MDRTWSNLWPDLCAYWIRISQVAFDLSSRVTSRGDVSAHLLKAKQVGNRRESEWSSCLIHNHRAIFAMFHMPFKFLLHDVEIHLCSSTIRG